MPSKFMQNTQPTMGSLAALDKTPVHSGAFVRQHAVATRVLHVSSPKGGRRNLRLSNNQDNRRKHTTSLLLTLPPVGIAMLGIARAA